MNWQYNEIYDFWINMEKFRIVRIEKEEELFHAVAIASNGDKVLLNIHRIERDLKNWLICFMNRSST